MTPRFRGATNLLINTCGKINILELNEAISYVREIVGEQVNIIWGTVTPKDFDLEKITITLVATGMNEKPLPLPAIPTIIPDVELKEWKTKRRTSQPVAPKTELVIPSFLTEARKRKD